MTRRKASRVDETVDENRRVLIRARATLAAFDGALEQLARNEKPLPELLLPVGVDVAKILQRFERDHSEAIAHAQAAREGVVSATQLARDWGARAKQATMENRSDLAGQASLRQKEHETEGQLFELDVNAWDEMVRYCEAAIERLRTRLPTSAPDALPN